MNSITNKDFYLGLRLKLHCYLGFNVLTGTVFIELFDDWAY